MNLNISDRAFSWALFFGFFGLYVHTCGGTTTPYRDVGEMAILTKTLSVAHPPGYPLYAIVGKIFTMIPLGNILYRVNILSAFSAAASIAILYLCLRPYLSKAVSVLASASFGFSNPFWELANVAEMYTLGILFFVMLLYAAFVLKSPLLFALLFPIGLGVRMDMLLLFPFFIAYFFIETKFKNWVAFGLIFAVGLSVFLYMPIRSSLDPLIDWGNPETIKALFNSLSRKSYGSTLDLLSLNYAKGENFLVNMSLFVSHLSRSFGLWALALILLGGWYLPRVDKKIGLFYLSVLFITCPFFLFLANMPPNPHSVAIVEAAYPIPDLVCVVLLGFGLTFLLKHIRFPKLVLGVIPVLMIVNSVNAYELASKRNNLFTRDYVENVFRSTPYNSVVAFHEDVQLFSLWQEQLLQNRRKDLTLVSTGLSGSSWFWEMQERWGTPPTPGISLKNEEGWVQMRKALGDRPFVAGQDTQVAGNTKLKLEPQGLLAEILNIQNPDKSQRNSQILTHLCLYRGPYIYGTTPDFFSSDLISDYSRAFFRAGLYEMKQGKTIAADQLFRHAERLEPLFPRPTLNRGYMAFRANRFEDAYALYQQTLNKHDKMRDLAVKYKSLPGVMGGIQRELADAHVYAGAAAEKLNNKARSRSHYRKAIQLSPNAQAYYNLAVTYWNEDWPKVLEYLNGALQINPQMEMARRYLPQAIAHSRRQLGGER